MNLEYQREYPSHQNLPHDEFMQHAHAQQQVHLQRQQRMDQEAPPTQPKKQSSKHQYLNKKIEKVQNWLPEIKSIKKMSKRHRSHSLPGQVESDDNFQDYKMNLKKQPPSTSSGGKKGDIYVMKSYMKGKKKDIVKTMSSMMHKAQKSVRRHSISHHHLSDDEGVPGSSPKSQQRATRSLSSAPSTSRYSDTETDISSIFSDSEAPLFATMADSMAKHSDAGDSDRNSSGDKAAVSDSSTGREQLTQDATQENQFNLNFTSTSMEFAASRKVGILRKKSTNNDDDKSDVSPTIESQEVIFEKSGKKHQHLMKTHSIFVDSIDGDERPVPAPRTTSIADPFEKVKSNGNGVKFEQVAPHEEKSPQEHPKPIPSPRFEHSRSNSTKNSLEIPGGGEEDSRSQHSFRTISSRRQSTEDSIDTDDEYFYYEMRNLEELERNSHMESILQDHKETINNIIQLDQNFIEPDDSVKMNMSIVLHELKAKVKLREPIEDFKQDLINNNNKKKDIYDKFGIATNINDLPWNRDSDEEYNDDGDYMNQLNQFECEIRDQNYGKVRKKRKKREKYEKNSSSSADDEDDKSAHLTVDKFERPHSQSSGVTSGPDSPIASDDDANAENYDEFKERQKNERLLEHSQQLEHPTDHRGASESIQAGSAAAATELKREQNDTVAPLKKRLMQLSSTISTDSTNQDSGISDTSGGAVGGSKWKLLKTLKERKEMNNQVKIQEEEEVKDTKKVRSVVNNIKEGTLSLFMGVLK